MICIRFLKFLFGTNTRTNGNRHININRSRLNGYDANATNVAFPFILPIVTFILFVISPAEFRVLNGLNFGMACMGMISPFPDVFNVLVVLRNSEKSDLIMFYKNDMYKIS